MMIRLLILSLHLLGVLCAPRTCMPNVFQGLTVALDTATVQQTFVDFINNRILTKPMKGDDFVFINISAVASNGEQAATIYTRKGDSCRIKRADNRFRQCIPMDLRTIPGNFGGPKGLKVKSFLFKNLYGQQAYLSVTTGEEHWPVAYGLIDPSRRKVEQEVLYYNLKRGIDDTSVFELDLDNCAEVID